MRLIDQFLFYLVRRGNMKQEDKCYKIFAYFTSCCFIVLSGVIIYFCLTRLFSTQVQYIITGLIAAEIIDLILIDILWMGCKSFFRWIMGQIKKEDEEEDESK